MFPTHSQTTNITEKEAANTDQLEIKICEEASTVRNTCKSWFRLQCQDIDNYNGNVFVLLLGSR